MISETHNQELIANKTARLNLEIQFAIEDSDLPSQKSMQQWAFSAISQDTVITIRIIDEPEGRTLNKQFCGKEYATNVLSFPYEMDSGLEGDIAICLPIVKKEAIQQNKTLHAHLAHLIIHGVLHIQGFTHDSCSNAKIMERKEKILLNRLGFENPYK
mgnify:CR=1 FL=1